MLTIDHLIDIIDREQAGGLPHSIAKHLLQATNDWPVSFGSVQEYLLAIKSHIRSQTITRADVELAIKNMNAATHA